MRHVCDVRPEDLGPYLLGGLDDREHRRVAAQVADCPACAAEVRRLQPVVDVMALASPPDEDEEPATIGPSSLDRVLEVLHEERRAVRRRVRRLIAVAAAAAVVLLSAGIGAVVLTRDDAPAPGQVALSGVGGATATATAVLDEREWGTAIEMEVRGLTPGEVYGAWLERRDGERVPAGSFRPDADGGARLALSAALDIADSGAVGVSWIGGEERQDVLRADLSG